MSDIALNDAGDIDLSRLDMFLVTGVDAIVQRLRIALQTFRGEWYLNTTVGLPYFKDIFVKRPNTGAISAAFKTVILGTPGVVSLDVFTLSFDAALRKLTLDFTVTVTTGEQVPIVQVI